MATNRSSTSLTIYLMKAVHKTAATALRHERSLDRHTIVCGAADTGTLYVQQRTASPPAWAYFFENQVQLAEMGAVSNTAAVLIIEIASRLFALTFGLGRYLLNEDALEGRFGLRVTLNSVRADKIRSIDKASFDELHRKTRTQANRLATPQEFGLDIEQDLLRAITGVPSDPLLGTSMSGLDSLHVSVPVTLSTLPSVLRRLLKQYSADTYRENFPWVDYISEISDAMRIGELNDELVARLKARNWRDVQLVLPGIIDWTTVSGFTFGGRYKNQRYFDLNIENWAKELGDDFDHVDVTRLHSSTAYCVNSNFDELDAWSIYNCLYSEIELSGQNYVLSGGGWYEIDRKFSGAVNRAMRQIKPYTGRLPVCSVPSEAKYNEGVAQANAAICLMDRKNISYGGGHSKIEFCDLFTSKHELIHIKWYGSSAVLSHLFSQGFVSGELFASDPEFRKLLNAKLDQQFKLADPTVRPDPNKYTVVFGIIGFDRDITKLPFFSRVNFRTAAKKLRGLGYDVRYVFIPADKTAKLKTVIRTRPAKKYC